MISHLIRTWYRLDLANECRSNNVSSSVIFSRDKLTFLYPNESHSCCSYHLTVSISHKAVGFSRFSIVPCFGEQTIQELGARPVPELFLVGYLFREQGENKIALQAMNLTKTSYFVSVTVTSWQYWTIASLRANVQSVRSQVKR